MMSEIYTEFGLQTHVYKCLEW